MGTLLRAWNLPRGFMVAVIHGIEIFKQLWHRSLGQDGAPSEEPIWERTNTFYLYTIAEYTPDLASESSVSSWSLRAHKLR